MLVLKDFSTSVLASTLAADAVSVDVADAGRFPVLSAGSYFYAVLQKFVDRTHVEIVKVVSVVGNTFTVVRGQAGTVPRVFAAGDYIELRLTVGVFDEYVAQRVAHKIDSVGGVVRQTLSFENAGDGVRSSFGVHFSDHHETIIGGATGFNAVSPSLHFRPLGRDNKTVEAVFTSDGVFSLFGGSAEIAARKLFLNSSDTSGWPNGAAASADNYARQWRSAVQANNSSLYLVGDGASNARRFGFQVGNADPALAHEVGVLELNPYGGDVRVNGGTVYHTNFLPTPAAIGAYPLKGGLLDGYLHAKSYVIAESSDGLNWVGLEAADGGAKPYISAKTNNVSRKVMEFDFDGSISLPATLHAQGINAAAWGDVFNAIGGTLRSNNATVMALDGKTYSFVTSPRDAHLCQNSYWDGVEWRKYDVNAASGYLAVSNGALKFNTSDAGTVDPRQRLESVYHTGHRPTPEEIGSINCLPWEDRPGTDANTLGNYTAFTYGRNAPYWGSLATFGTRGGKYAMQFNANCAASNRLSFRTHNGDVAGAGVWGSWSEVYHTDKKPSSEELNVIGINKKNYLNNVDILGVGFIAAREVGAGWIATYLGSDAGDKVVMGSLSGKSTICGHIPDCTNWADLYVNTQHGHAGISSSTIIGNPYAKNTDDTAVYRVYHEGYKPTAHGIGAAPDGFGVGGYCADIGTVLGDCNLRRQGGFFQGVHIEGMPTEGHAFKYVINLAHANPAGYFGYIAMDFDLNHAWLGGQADGLQKQKKFVFQADRFIAAGATGSDYNNSPIEVLGSGGGIKPTIGFHQPSEFAASIGLWFGDQFRFHTQGLTDYAGIMVGLANVSDIYIRSDVRLKTNFVEMRGALDKLSLLQAYYYDKKGMLSSDDYNTHELGLKAQDVEAVEPVAVRRTEDSSGGSILSISGSAINAMLVQAINELRGRVEELERNARS